METIECKNKTTPSPGGSGELETSLRYAPVGSANRGI